MSNATGDFKELIESNRTTGLFVDKTLLAREVIGNKDPLLITRPRRWGKTLNMNMLFYYFVHRDQLKGMGKHADFITACNALFEGLHIFDPQFNADVAHTRTHFGQYPVIFISFALSGDDSNTQDTHTPDWEKIKRLIVNEIAVLFFKFNYLAQDLQKRVEAWFDQAYTHHPAVGISFYGTRLVLKVAESDQIITR